MNEELIEQSIKWMDIMDKEGPIECLDDNIRKLFLMEDKGLTIEEYNEVVKRIYRR